MAILPITVYGDEILKKKTKPVKQINDKIIFLIRDMFNTMRNANGIGLAANQVSNLNSLFIVDLSPVEGFAKFKPLVLINPKIMETSDEFIVMEEGCLSLPNLRTDVERPEFIKVKYLDTDENEQVLETDDLLSRVILHEYDHLIGKMIPDRVVPAVRKKIKKHLLRIMKREEEIDYLITQKK